MADRIGVINKGEIILVEDKAELMRKLGKKQMTLELREPLDAMPGGARRPTISTLADDGRKLDLHLRHPGRAAPASRRCSTICGAPASSSRICRPRESSLEDIFVEPGEAEQR